MALAVALAVAVDRQADRIAAATSDNPMMAPNGHAYRVFRGPWYEPGNAQHLPDCPLCAERVAAGDPNPRRDADPMAWMLEHRPGTVERSDAYRDENPGYEMSN